MTRTRAVLLAILAVVAAVWASSPAGAPAPGAVGGRDATSAGDPGRRPLVFDLQVATDRLRDQAAATVAPRDSARNPFRFEDQTRASREPQAARPLSAASATPSVAVAPTISLLGIVDRTVDGQPVRVAVVSMSDTLYYVSAGERIGTRYDVVAVGADAIEVKDLNDGSSKRVALR